MWAYFLRWPILTRSTAWQKATPALFFLHQHLPEVGYFQGDSHGVAGKHSEVVARLHLKNRCGADQTGQDPTKCPGVLAVGPDKPDITVPSGFKSETRKANGEIHSPFLFLKRGKTGCNAESRPTMKYFREYVVNAN